MERLDNYTRNQIIKNLLLEEDHRQIVQRTIDTIFLKRVIDFFSKVASAKLARKEITHDWYRDTMLSEDLEKEDIAWNAGLNLKSINNIHKSTTKPMVIKVSKKHYDELLKHIDELIEDDIDVTLTITLNNVSVMLSLNESMIVINAIAVMRSGLRGGIWSTMGKQIEKPLMLALCGILHVKKKYYVDIKPDDLDNPRESDFFLRNDDGKSIRCEVKLMGKGNPESADGAMARDAKLFVADKLSEQNKGELNKNGIKWVAMADGGTLRQFSSRLTELNIPNVEYKSDLSIDFLDKILKEID